MKHLLTAIACFFALSMSAQTWNPDADFDNVIGVNDLMELLTVFGTEWTGEYPQDVEYELAAYDAGSMDYFECVRTCTNNHAKIIGMHEFAMFEDSILINTPIIDTGGNSQQNIWLSDSKLNLGRLQLDIYSWGAEHHQFKAFSDFPFDNPDYQCFCSGLVPAVE